VRAALGSRARLVKAIRRAPLLLPAAGNISPQHNSDQQQPADQQQQQHRKKPKHSHKQQQQQQQQQQAVVPADTNKGGSSRDRGSGGICVPRRILVGAVVDPVAVLRLVDVGPAADDAAAAAKFRKLWGDKSELRR